MWNLPVLRHEKMNMTPKNPVYNHVWFQQNQAKIYPQSGKSPKVFKVSEIKLDDLKESLSNTNIDIDQCTAEQLQLRPL